MLKARGNFVKLLLHKCYVNPLNLMNQVGLIAVNVLGSPVPGQHHHGHHGGGGGHGGRGGQRCVARGAGRAAAAALAAV